MTRHELSVIFYPTTVHPLENIIEQAGFIYTVEGCTYTVTHEKTGMNFIYPYGNIHEPRDEGNGVKFVSVDPLGILKKA